MSGSGRGGRGAGARGRGRGQGRGNNAPPLSPQASAAAEAFGRVGTAITGIGGRAVESFRRRPLGFIGDTLDITVPACVTVLGNVLSILDTLVSAPVIAVMDYRAASARRALESPTLPRFSPQFHHFRYKPAEYSDRDRYDHPLAAHRRRTGTRLAATGTTLYIFLSKRQNFIAVPSPSGGAAGVRSAVRDGLYKDAIAGFMALFVIANLRHGMAVAADDLINGESGSSQMETVNSNGITRRDGPDGFFNAPIAQIQNELIAEEYGGYDVAAFDANNARIGELVAASAPAVAAVVVPTAASRPAASGAASGSAASAASGSAASAASGSAASGSAASAASGSAAAAANNNNEVTENENANATATTENENANAMPENGNNAEPPIVLVPRPAAAATAITGMAGTASGSGSGFGSGTGTAGSAAAPATATATATASTGSGGAGAAPNRSLATTNTFLKWGLIPAPPAGDATLLPTFNLHRVVQLIGGDTSRLESLDSRNLIDILDRLETAIMNDPKLWGLNHILLGIARGDPRTVCSVGGARSVDEFKGMLEQLRKGGLSPSERSDEDAAGAIAGEIAAGLEGPAAFDGLASRLRARGGVVRSSGASGGGGGGRSSSASGGGGGGGGRRARTVRGGSRKLRMRSKKYSRKSRR